MGGCASTGNLLERNDGDLDAYKARFIEDKVLGEGEFGQVKLVFQKNEAESATRTSFACKTLRKGAVFKDNTLYPALPKEILVSEIEMLRKLNGDKYCMRLVAIYETPKALLMVTDCYDGGELMEYVSKQKEDLRTEDVSRIAFQLLSAVDHCAKNDIIHRDIKPENAMFVTEKPGSDVRLIDFGSGTMKVVEGMHTTFAGTPFYNSPEMFQHTYTTKTDVWSVGVVLYVLVAGYPSEKLQKAFNLLMDGKRTSLKQLPGMPEDMPETFYEMLNLLLTYRHKGRKSAGSMLENDFVVFHKDLMEAKTSGEEEKAEMESGDTFAPPAMPTSPAGRRQSRMRRTSSIALRGSVKRHSLFLDFKAHERSLTTILATMLNESELIKLLCILAERHGTGGDGNNPTLEVVSVKELKDILNVEIGNQACLGVMQNLPNSDGYNGFAYHTSLLKEFVPKNKLEAAMNDTDGNDKDTTLAKEDEDALINIGATIHGKASNRFAGTGGGTFGSSSARPNMRKAGRAQSVMVF